MFVHVQISCKIKKFKHHILSECATFQTTFAKGMSGKPNLQQPVCTADSTLSMCHTAGRNSASARTMAPTEREVLYSKIVRYLFHFFARFSTFDSTIRLPVVDFIPTGPKKSVGLANLHGRWGATRENLVIIANLQSLFLAQWDVIGPNQKWFLNQ